MGITRHVADQSRAYLVERDIRMPVRLSGGQGKGAIEWGLPQSDDLLNLFANTIYAGVYAYGVWAVEKRRQKPSRTERGVGRRAPVKPKFFCIYSPLTSASSATSAIMRS